jgi:hypothetical protein
MNELRAQLRQLFPADTKVDWDDVLARAGGDRKVRRLLLAAAALVAAVLIVGSALALTGRFDRLLHGRPVNDLTPRERFILSEFDMKGRVELVATHGSRAFFVIRKADGSACYFVGRTRQGLTPAQAELRTRFGSGGCLAKGIFPSRALPVLDFSFYQLRPGEAEARLMGLEGFAADPVRKIGVIGRDNRVVYSIDVNDNVYTKRGVGIRGARGIVALDEDGKPLWVQCMAGHGASALHGFPRGGCGKYKSSPPPKLPRPRPAKPVQPPGPIVVQRGSADGVTVVVRGSEVEARFDGLSAASRKLLVSRDGRINIGCFRLVTIAGKRFSDSSTITTTYATFVRTRLSSPAPGRRFSAPFDACVATGMYGHRWNDARGTHDLVEIPLTAKGRRFFAERAVARDIAWLARARRFQAVRYAQRPFTSATAAAYLAKRVDPLARLSDTPPLRHIGIWLGPNRRIVLVERAPTGRRLFLELRRGVIYRTNLGGLASVL